MTPKKLNKSPSYTQFWEEEFSGLLTDRMRKTSIILLLAVIFFYANNVKGMTGFDISLQDCNGAYSSDLIWACFADSGFGFSVIESVQGGNGMTSSIKSCVGGASRNGLYVSLYGWFCPNCYGQSDAYSTAYNVIKDLKSQGIYPTQNYTYFYIDVEECDPLDNCWQTYDVNKQYLLDLVSGAQDAGASVGIYSSDYEWKLLFGSDSWSSPNLTALPLWYANWNNVDGMGGWSPFGGWTTPHMHQYADYCYGCCGDVDLDFIY